MKLIKTLNQAEHDIINLYDNPSSNESEVVYQQ